MNPIPNPALHRMGRVCVLLAGFLYAFPLQYVLLELSQNRSADGEFVAAILILVPMWLLLGAGMHCVTAAGAFDGSGWSRVRLHLLTALGMLALAAVSAFRIEVPPHPPGTGSRIAVALVFHLICLLTFLVAILGLHPRLAPGLRQTPVILSWTLCTALSLAACAGWSGYRSLAKARSRTDGITHTLAGTRVDSQSAPQALEESSTKFGYQPR